MERELKHRGQQRKTEEGQIGLGQVMSGLGNVPNYIRDLNHKLDRIEDKIDALITALTRTP